MYIHFGSSLQKVAKLFNCLLMAKVRTQRHIDREKARKRSKSLVYKAHELGRIPIVKVYLVIERGGKIDRYKSTDQPGWPPSEEQMVRFLHTNVHAFPDMSSGQAFSYTSVYPSR